MLVNIILIALFAPCVGDLDKVQLKIKLYLVVGSVFFLSLSRYSLIPSLRVISSLHFCGGRPCRVPRVCQRGVEPAEDCSKLWKLAHPQSGRGPDATLNADLEAVLDFHVHVRGRGTLAHLGTLEPTR